MDYSIERVESIEMPGEDAESAVVAGNFGRFRLKVHSTLMAALRGREQGIDAQKVATALFARWPDRLATIADAVRAHREAGLPGLFVYPVNWSESVRNAVLAALNPSTGWPTIHTLGYGSTPWPQLAALLTTAGIQTVCDVRSNPHSARRPEMARQGLARGLQSIGMRYVHMVELGGRPHDESSYREGVADYERMAEAPEFRNALGGLIARARVESVALLCAETDPACCHRCLLVGRRLGERGAEVVHLLHDGRRELQSSIEARLIQEAGVAPAPLFAGPEDHLRAIEAAYRWQNERVAFRRDDADVKSRGASADA